jgi:hypothetical protein
MRRSSVWGIRLDLIALLIAVIIVSGSITFLVTKTRAGPTSTETITTTVTSTPLLPPLELHKVVFNETGISCGGPMLYADSWAVTLGGITIAQPSNATLPVSGNFDAAQFQSIHTIIFTMPDGRYDYNVTTTGNPPSPQRGSVTVNGSDQVVQLNFPQIPCYGGA